MIKAKSTFVYIFLSIILYLCLARVIPKKAQKLEFCQSQRSRFDPIETAPIQMDRSDAEGVKDGDADTGKNQVLSFLGYIPIANQKLGISESQRNDQDISCFLENVMIRENGIYTLLGSKPITTFRIENEFSLSTDEIASEYERLIDDIPSLKQKISLSDYKKNIHQAQKIKHLRYKNLWTSWNKTYGNQKCEKYLFISRCSAHGEGSEGLFINIPLTMHVLSKYKGWFKERVGMAFNPNEIISELSEEHSEFWDKVFKDHFLTGLLLGYGVKNSLFWEIENQLNGSLRCQAINQTIKDSDYSNILANKDITIRDLLIPYFVSYSLYDPEIDRYEKERRQIINTISQNQFIPLVFQKLGI